MSLKEIQINSQTKRKVPSHFKGKALSFSIHQEIISISYTVEPCYTFGKILETVYDEAGNFFVRPENELAFRKLENLTEYWEFGKAFLNFSKEFWDSQEVKSRYKYGPRYDGRK